MAAVWAAAEHRGANTQVDAFGYEDVNVAVATLGSGLMWANMLRAFQLGKARTSHDGPWSWMRESRVASVQVSWPACHLTKASASAVMYRSSSRPGYVLQISFSRCSISSKYRSWFFKPLEEN